MVRDVVSGYAATKGDLDALEARIEIRLSKLRDDLTVRLGVMLAAGLTLLFLALEYAPG